MSTNIRIEIEGSDETSVVLREIVKGLSSRAELHAAMAVPAQQTTQNFLLSLKRHRTASRLGAKPTNFHEKNAGKVTADHDENAAYVRIPRNTGLGRAFHDVNLVPGAGRKYLTIPADPRTYGRGVRDFPEGTFKFASLGQQIKHPALVFAIDGKVGFWLRKSVHQKQDRSLLPSDALYSEVAKRSAVAYISRLIDESGNA